MSLDFDVLKSACLLTLAFVLAAMFISAVLKKLFPQLSIGNASVAKIIADLKARPFWAFLCLIVLAPILEETLFRGIAHGLLYMLGIDGHWWLIGGVLAVAFAASHGLVTVDNRRIWPLPQLFFGLWFWYVCREYGFVYAVLVHIFQNGCVGFVVMCIGLRRGWWRQPPLPSVDAAAGVGAA